MQTVVESWQAVGQDAGRCAGDGDPGHFSLVLHAGDVPARPDFTASLAEFVRARPKQSVSCFIDHANAVIAHDALAELPRIKAPTHITFGARDVITSTRFRNH